MWKWTHVCFGNDILHLWLQRSTSGSHILYMVVGQGHAAIPTCPPFLQLSLHLQQVTPDQRLLLPLATFCTAPAGQRGWRWGKPAVSSVEDLVITSGFKDTAQPSDKPFCLSLAGKVREHTSLALPPTAMPGPGHIVLCQLEARYRKQTGCVAAAQTHSHCHNSQLKWMTLTVNYLPSSLSTGYCPVQKSVL